MLACFALRGLLRVGGLGLVILVVFVFGVSRFWGLCCVLGVVASGFGDCATQPLPGLSVGFSSESAELGLDCCCRLE